MKYLKKIPMFAAIAGLALGGTHAQAQVSSYALIGPLTFTLTDIDLADGISPSITFSTADSYVEAGITKYSQDYIDFEREDSTRLTPQISSTASFHGVRGSATIEGTSALATGTAIGWGYGFRSTAVKTTAFTLSANTALTVSGHVNLTAPADVGATTTSVAEISISDSQSFKLSSFYEFSMEHIGVPGFDNDFSLTATNASSSEMLGSIFAMAATVGGYSFAGPIPSPVPEPATYGMLMAGLGLLGYMSRRKQHK